jgi:signal transduction histidine kinase
LKAEDRGQTLEFSGQKAIVIDCFLPFLYLARSFNIDPVKFMNDTRNFIIALLTILFFAGCKQTSDYSPSAITQSQQTVLSDSLLKLDSLVLRNRAIRFSESLKYAKRAYEIAKKLNTPYAFARSYIMSGEVYFSFKKDSAFYFYNKALQVIDSFQLVKEKGKVLYDIGMLHGAAGNYKTSVAFLDSALVYSKVIFDTVTISNSLNALGNIYHDMGNDTNARKMFDSAFSIAKARSLYLQMGAALGNLAKFEQDQKKSIIKSKNALALLRKTSGSGETMAMILINIGFRFPEVDSAIYYFRQALQMVDVETSPEVVIGAYNNLANSYLDKNDVLNAEKCIAYGLTVSINTNNFDWQSTIYDTYSDIMKRKGDLSKALTYEKKSIEAMEKANKLSAFKQVRLFVSLLDLKNKESIIKDDKVKIEKAYSGIRNRNQVITIIVLVVFILLGFFIGMRQKEKIQIKNQQIESAKKILNAEENEKAKIGRDFHDLIGQKFSGFYWYLENIEFPDSSLKTTTLNMLKELKETVREISHRLNRSWLEKYTLDQSLRGLCADVIKMTQLKLEFRSPDEYPEIPLEIKVQIYRIIQELISNAVKHAPASKVIIEISFKNKLLLTYTDDGPGFSKEKVNNGIGLNNLFERVKLLNGEIELNTLPGFGTYYSIKIPLT